MTEKQASSEIAQSRFEKWAETSPVMDHYGDRDVWDDIWLVAEAMYIAAERDTRERIAQLLQDRAEELSRKKVEEVSPPSPELWETLAQAMCRNEYSASRSLDEQVTPSRQLWQRFETEAKFAIEAIENAGYKISKHESGDTRELKAAIREVLTQLQSNA